MKKAILSFSGLTYILVPALVFAQRGDLFETAGTFAALLKIIIPIIITLVVIFFFIGVIKFVTAKDETKRAEGRQTMLNGVIGLFVILSIWGIIAILQRTFKVDTQTEIDFPTVIFDF